MEWNILIPVVFLILLCCLQQYQLKKLLDDWIKLAEKYINVLIDLKKYKDTFGEI